MDVPHLPEDQSDSLDQTPMTLRTKIIGASIVVALALIVVLHLSGTIGK